MEASVIVGVEFRGKNDGVGVEKDFDLVTELFQSAEPVGLRLKGRESLAAAAL